MIRGPRKQLAGKLRDLCHHVAREPNGLDERLRRRERRREARDLRQLHAKRALVLGRRRPRHDRQRPDRLPAAIEDDRDLLAGVAIDVGLQIAGPRYLLAVDRPNGIARFDPGHLGR